MPEMPLAGLDDAVQVVEVSKEEINLATEIMQSFVKTSKGFRMYLPNNPLLIRFIEDLKSKLGKHLSLYGDYRLDIDQFELFYKGKSVYQNRDPKESMAFKMYSDGIRFLILSEGIEEYEVCEFLEIVGKDRPGDVDDDIVTLLWEKNLPHVTHILAEDFLEFDAAASGMHSPTSQQEKIRGIYQSMSTTNVAPTPFLIPQKILTLTEEEADWLKKAREAEEIRKPLDEVIQILTSILIGEKDPEMFGDFFGIMVKLTQDLAHAGEIRYAFSLLKFLGKLGYSDKIPPVSGTVIADGIAAIFSERTLQELVRMLDTSEVFTPEELLEILHIFGKPSLGRMCQMLGLVEKMKVRKVILQALIEIGKDTPEAFYPFLSDPKWYVVRNMVFILTRIGTGAALDQVVGAISHKEIAVRREVLTYLEKMPDPKAKTYLLKFLRDDSSAIRIKALQILASSRCSFALKPIIAISASDQFAEKEMVEKKAVYEAMGELGSDQMIPLFREMLMKKFWFNKAREKESVLCAVAGLMKIRSVAAVSLLQEAHGAKSDEIKDLVSQALEAMPGGAKDSAGA